MPRILVATLTTAILGLALLLALSMQSPGGPADGVAFDRDETGVGPAAGERTPEPPQVVSQSKRRAPPDRHERGAGPRHREAPDSAVEPTPLSIHITGCGPELERVTARLRSDTDSGPGEDAVPCTLERHGELASGVLPRPRTRGARIELELVDRAATPRQTILVFDVDIDLKLPASKSSIWHLDLSTVRYEFVTDRAHSFFVGDSTFEPYTCSRVQSAKTSTATRYLPPLQRYVIYSTDVPLRESFRDFAGRIVHRGPWTPGFHVLRF
ncbi:MAG: hypothetical protein H6832_05230 [Planctomycetes bacterium]|nr:hypothetical protein [Planctomycetota bacterium]